MKRKAYFGIPVLISVLFILPLTLSGEETGLSEVLSHLALGEVRIRKDSLPEFLFGMFPVFVFQIVWGNQIYQHFCSASVYYFSRCTGRVRWYWRESGKLLFVCFLYQALLVAAGAGTVCLFGKLQVDGGSIGLLLYYLWIYTLWTYAAALSVNLLAVCLDSAWGFGIVAGVEVSCIVLFGLWEKWMDFENIPVEQMGAQAAALKWNPISHLVLKWHSSGMEGMEEHINEFGISFDLNLSAAAVTCAALAVTVAGMAAIKRRELLSDGD